MDSEDPSFTNGAAYYARNEDYQDYLQKMEGFADAQAEVRNLS